MTFTYDVSTDVGKVRLLIPDNDEPNVIFQDNEIEAFISLEGNDVLLATALALETIASQQAYVLKVITILDITTDGAAVAEALMNRAAKLREQAETDVAAFDIAEFIVDEFTWRERLVKESVRET